MCLSRTDRPGAAPAPARDAGAPDRPAAGVGGDPAAPRTAAHLQRRPQARKVVHAQLALAARIHDALDVACAQPGYAQQHLARRRVEVDREAIRVAQRPCQLGVDVQVEHAALPRNVCHDFLHVEPVEPQQPVGLVQAVLAQQRRRAQRQLGGGIGNGTEGGVIHPAHAELAVQRIAADQDRAVVRGIGTDDHLRALPGRRELRRSAALRLRFLLAGLRGEDARMQFAHRGADARRVFLWRELLQAGFRRQFHVDAQAVGVASCGRQQLGRRLGNRLQVDVAGEAVIFAQAPRHFHQLLHGVVAIADDAAGEEQPFDVVALVELQRQPHHLGGGEARARDVARNAVDAVGAVVDAEIGQQDLEQRYAASVWRVRVADAHALGTADATLAQRMPLARAAGCARGIVLGRIGQDRQLVFQLHGRILASDCMQGLRRSVMTLKPTPHSDDLRTGRDTSCPRSRDDVDVAFRNRSAPRWR